MALEVNHVSALPGFQTSLLGPCAQTCRWLQEPGCRCHTCNAHPVSRKGRGGGRMWHCVSVSTTWGGVLGPDAVSAHRKIQELDRRLKQAAIDEYRVEAGVQVQDVGILECHRCWRVHKLQRLARKGAVQVNKLAPDLVHFGTPEELQKGQRDRRCIKVRCAAPAT
jgi:hypothetical protein